MEDAELVLEFKLATLGIDRCGVDGDAAARSAEAVTDASAVVRPRFDPEFALRFLKWREEKRRGKPTRGGRPAAPPDFETARESIMRKVNAIVQHDEREKLGQGWTRDEATEQMIPPGWVCSEQPAGEEGAAE